MTSLEGRSSGNEAEGSRNSNEGKGETHVEGMKGRRVCVCGDVCGILGQLNVALVGEIWSSSAVYILLEVKVKAISGRIVATHSRREARISVRRQLSAGALRDLSGYRRDGGELDPSRRLEDAAFK